MASKKVREVQQDFAKMNLRRPHMPVTTILVLVARQEKPDTDIFNCEEYTCHHIISKNKTDASSNSRIFIDENGITYNSWECYKQENKLGRGIMVAPLNGHYSFDENGDVNLEFLETLCAPTTREAQQDFANDIGVTSSNSKSNRIYVLVTNSNNFKDAENSRKFTYHPVLRSQTKNGESETFVDEDGNSYDNWECYKKTNSLDCGIMVAPLNGHYSFDENGKVKLEFSETTPGALNTVYSPVKSEILETPVLNTAATMQCLTIREFHRDFANKSKVGGENSTSKTIFVLVTTQADLYDAINSRTFTSHSVLRKEDAIAGSNIFVDDCNIEYRSWDLFINQNKLPEGVMVAPLNGIYSFDENGDVQLEVCLTPPLLPKIQETIGGLQQRFATTYKYSKTNSMILHVLFTSNECKNVLEAKEFKDFCVKRICCEETDFLYEDDNGNTYSNWESYMRNNDLPDGIMVAPLNGEYTFNNDGNVQLDIRPTTTRRKKIRTVMEMQQEFANNSGFNKEIIWDLLSAEQSGVLVDKIVKLIPDQETGQRRITAMRKLIFDSIWAQRKYTNGNSLSAIIYVFVADCENKYSALMSKEFSCHPVFRTRKCTTKGDSSDCCMIFVDELGRVYKNWKTYVSNNELPAGKMVAPRNGIYTTDCNGAVQLDVFTTPNGSIGTKAIGYADTATTIAGLGAAAVPLAGLMLTVAPPVMLGAAAICGATAAYSTLRSAFNLIDRKQHEQPIGLNDPQARNSWLGVGAGVIGMGASRATRVMTAAAAAGQEVSVITEIVVNGMNISSIVLSGTGVASGILDLILKYRDDEELSSMDLVQLTASLVLFTHSVSNFRLASTLVNETRHATILDYRKSLSIRQRKIFDKMSKETIRIRGVTRGKVDIIRSVNDMPSKQYLNDLYKVNKKLNAAKVRPSFGSAGEGVVLNNEVSVDTSTLRNNIQHNQGPNVLNTVTKPIPGSHPETIAPCSSRLLVSKQLDQWPGSGAGALGMASIILPNKVLISLKDYGTRLYEIIANAESFEDIITTMADAYTEKAFNFLMKLAQEFVEVMMERLRANIKIFISAESILYRIFVHCQTQYNDQSYEFLSRKKHEILNAIRNYFSSLNPNNYNNLQQCDICGGSYSICQL